MSDIDDSRESSSSPYGRLESAVLEKLPTFITSLRLRILVGYLLVLLLTIYGWEQLAAAWRYLLTLLAPAAALLGALMALKLSVVFVSLFSLLVALLKFFFGFLVIVLKPGILKAILIPQLISLASWAHQKSERLQGFFKKLYNFFKSLATRLMDWWKAQHFVDKLLLSGFLIPLLTVLLLVFIIEKAVTIFAVKKFSEQVVQRTTKLVIKHFHKLPIVGSIPTKVATATRKLTAKKDREDIANDLKDLGHEIYEAEDSNSRVSD